MKTVVHVISHSHWDREWYLPFEEHRGRLLKLMDDCMEAFSEGDTFKNFHLDGQTIALEDYLEVYPDKKEELKKYVQDGRFKVGPWYILQDEFLTSGEANVRNLLYGMETARAFGEVCKVGYFPDSFGNVGQAPQMMKQAGMEAIVFGRGVRPVGFNNMVSGQDYLSAFSELNWESPDGSAMLGILFANWYNNGNEIPVEEEAAKEYWDRKLKEAGRFASTEHLLFMNGCDHQPLQKDLPQALETARRLYPDITFIHSDFPYYIQCVKESLKENTSVVKGELTSQETDGFDTLVNTASSRNYLKTANRESEVLLEKAVEPLSVMAMSEGMDYPHDKLRFNWKLLMQNHPHDSICGCSVDPVHQEMEVRFNKSRQFSGLLLEEGKNYMASRISTEDFLKYGETAYPFAVWNTNGWNQTEEIEMCLELYKAHDDLLPEAYEKMEKLPLGEWRLVNSKGEEIPCVLEDLGVGFGFTLPERTFRTRYMARRVKVSFRDCLAGTSYQTYALVPGKKAELAKSGLITGENTMENELLAVTIQPNGAFTVTDKATGKVFADQGLYEDTGDVGNEYIFRETMGKAITTEHGKASIRVKENLPWKAVFAIDTVMQIPEKADEKLAREQMMVTDSRSRKIGRGENMVDLEIHTELILEKESNHLDINVRFENKADDHRVRILFPTDLETGVHKADTVFEVVTRPNHHSDVWKNPSECERQQYFVAMHDGQAGVMVANRGEYEYEILHNRNTIAITLLRAVGEMGDWGYFPTPEAQCRRVTEAHLRWTAQTGEVMEREGYAEAVKFQRGFTCKQVPVQKGELPMQKEYLTWSGVGLALTGYKAANDGNGVIVRFVNTCQEETTLEVPYTGAAFKSNIIEEAGEKLQANAEGIYRTAVGPYEIVTLRLS
ncbi:MAG: alpha-mannosidase [Clostridiales bacterium]|nr:alpha-mannosidase [Clostridiales bacterium]